MQVTQRNIMRSPQTHTHADSLPLSFSPFPTLPKLPLNRCPTHTHIRSSHEAAKDLVWSQVRREGGEQELMFFNLEMRSELKYTKLIKIPISKKERVREKKCQRKEKTIQNSLCLFDAVFDHAAFVTTQARHAPSANNTNAVACANISRGGRESTTAAAEAAAETERDEQVMQAQQQQEQQ